VACASILLAAVVATPHAARAQIFPPIQDLYVSPSLPTTQDDVVLEAVTICFNPLEPPTIAGKTITLIYTDLVPPPPCAFGFPPLVTSYPLGKLAAGSYTVRVVLDDTQVYAFGFQVGILVTAIDLATSRFRVRVARIADCSPGPVCLPAKLEAPLVRTSDNSAYAWFYDGSNVEVTTKILDGRALTGHFWVFIASMTDRPFIVTITDLHTPAFCVDSASAEPPAGRAPCVTRDYIATAGTNRNFIDFDHLGGP
jgi:hypothetical protein